MKVVGEAEVESCGKCAQSGVVAVRKVARREEVTAGLKLATHLLACCCCEVPREAKDAVGCVVVMR